MRCRVFVNQGFAKIWQFGAAFLFSIGVFFSYSVTADEVEDAIVERIKPVGSVCVDGGDGCPTESSASSAVASSAPAESAGRSGEAVYTAACFACHGTGAAGAPKLGDVAAWQPRIAQGEDVLFDHAWNGFNVMPPKGGCAACTEDEIKAAVEHMVSNSQ